MSIYNTKEGWNITCNEYRTILEHRFVLSPETIGDEDGITYIEYLTVIMVRLTINYEHINKAWKQVLNNELSINAQVKFIRKLDKLLRQRHRAIYHDCIYDDTVLHVEVILEFEALEVAKNECISLLIEGN